MKRAPYVNPTIETTVTADGVLWSVIVPDVYDHANQLITGGHAEALAAARRHAADACPTYTFEHVALVTPAR